MAPAQTAQGPLPPEAQEAVHKGVLAANQQDYLLAIRYFQDARKTAPQSAEIYYDLGLAESKIPGRELRSIAWFGAYLAAYPNAPNATAVKDQVDALDVKSQSNISRFIAKLQDQVRQSPASFAPLTKYMGIVARLWVFAGDEPAARKLAAAFNRDADAKNDIWAAISLAQFQEALGGFDWIQMADRLSDALKTADLIKNAVAKNKCKILEQDNLVLVQKIAGNISGAQSTVESMSLELKGLDPGDIDTYSDTVDDARLVLALGQIEAGLLRDAQLTADAMRPGLFQSEALGAIALEQALSGDIAGAQANVTVARKGLIGKDTGPSYNSARDSVVNALKTIAEAQLRAGDAIGARQTADLIPGELPYYFAFVGQIDRELALSLRGAPSEVKFTNSSSIRKATDPPRDTAGVRPKLSDWLKMLDDGDQSHVRALDTAPFLDLAAFLKSMPPDSDPKSSFATEEWTIESVAKAQLDIDAMLSRQARK
jgi:hypothetical protein